MSHNHQKEQSYGIVPLQQVKGEWHVLLIQHGSSKYWGFPKGHAEEGESPQEAAIRELKEETNLDVVKFLSESVLEEHYHFVWHGKHVAKTVYFFVAQVIGDLALQAEEVSDSRWMPLASAESFITFDTDKSILRNALKLL